LLWQFWSTIHYEIKQDFQKKVQQLSATGMKPINTADLVLQTKQKTAEHMQHFRRKHIMEGKGGRGLNTQQTCILNRRDRLYLKATFY